MQDQLGVYVSAGEQPAPWTKHSLRQVTRDARSERHDTGKRLSEWRQRLKKVEKTDDPEPPKMPTPPASR